MLAEQCFFKWHWWINLKETRDSVQGKMQTLIFMNLLLSGSFSIQAIYRIFSMFDYHCFWKFMQRKSIELYLQFIHLFFIEMVGLVWFCRYKGGKISLLLGSLAGIIIKLIQERLTRKKKTNKCLVTSTPSIFIGNTQEK